MVLILNLNSLELNLKNGLKIFDYHKFVGITTGKLIYFFSIFLISGTIFLRQCLSNLFIGQSNYMVEQFGVFAAVFNYFFYNVGETTTRCRKCRCGEGE